MRVALVYPRHAADGGVERYLDQLARHLAEGGHQVTVVCRRHADPPHPGVGFARLRPFALGAVWRARAFAGAVARHLAQAGYDRVLALGRSTGHDCIRLGMGCHATYLERMGRRAGWADRAELALEAASLAPAGFRGPRRVICNARMVAADAAIRYGLRPDELTVIHNGCDLERFHPGRHAAAGDALRRQLGLGDEPAALFVGSGFARKGLDIVLDALARCRRGHLLVAGRDARQADYARRAAALGLDGRVHLLGVRRDVEALYAAADCFCLPTRYDPFANATVEALASGRAVLTTDANGGAEALADGLGAVLPAGAGAEAWGAALGEWLERGRSPDVRAACRTRAEGFDIRITLERSAGYLLGQGGWWEVEGGRCPDRAVPGSRP